MSFSTDPVTFQELNRQVRLVAVEIPRKWTKIFNTALFIKQKTEYKQTSGRVNVTLILKYNKKYEADLTEQKEDSDIFSVWQNKKHILTLCKT